MSSSRFLVRIALAGTMVLLAACEAPVAEAPPDPIQRGGYLVGLMGCNDCHTPGYFLGMPDQTRFLGGSDVGFLMPGLGYFYGPNLTPDVDTGLGSWSEDQIITTLRTGVRPDGRQLAPIMPWMAFASLTDEDANAIAAYLKSIPAVSNQAPPPTGIGQPAPAPYMEIIFPPPPAEEPPPAP